MRLGACLALFSLVLIAGCSTDRRYTVTQDRMVEAAIAAISEEAYVHPGEIKRTDKDENGGRITTLCAPYDRYSEIKVQVDSTDEHKGLHPELRVEITTPQVKAAGTDVVFTRHKEWEQRIHELVRMKLLARKHGAESKPTSLPATVPGPPEPKSGS